MLNNFKNGNIGTFYSEVYPSLLTYAARYLGQEFSFLAEDCVQEAVFQAYDHRSSFSSPMRFKSFLYACVHNNAVSILRKSHSKSNYVSQTKESYDNLDNTIIEQETLDLLYDAIDHLPEELRRLFDMSFEQGLKNIEIAELLHLSESSVKKKKAKMISMIRKSVMDDSAMQLLIAVLLGLIRD